MEIDLVDYIGLVLMAIWILIEWIIKFLELIRDA